MTTHPAPFRRLCLQRLASLLAPVCAAAMAPGLAAWPVAPAAAATPRSRDAGLGLALAVEAPHDVDPAGWLVSEKLDGVRALWTGSSLRFRSGLPVAAPDWFTAGLPQGVALDGELWLGRGRFEALSGAVRRAAPVDAQWRAISFQVFDMPRAAGSFVQRQQQLAELLLRLPPAPLEHLRQVAVPNRAALQQMLQTVLAAGGEGLMLQRADAPYLAGRSGAVLKLKPLHDAEAVVLAHVPGQGRHAGRLGALRVRTPDGVEFLIGTGFTDAQREQPPALGSVVTYTHRGITAGGVPRFASFLRERPL